MADNSKALKFLKKLAEDPTKSVDQVAEEVDIPRSTCYSILKDFSGLVALTINDDGRTHPMYPGRVLKFYNKKIPPEQQLTEEEVLELQTLVPKVGETLIKKEEPQQSNIQMMSQNTPDLTTNATLLKHILEQIPRIPLANIPKFLELFQMQEQIYMSDPDKLLALLAGFFGPTPGRMAYETFRMAVPQYVPPQNMPYGMGMGIGMGMKPMPGNGNGYSSPMYNAYGAYAPNGMMDPMMAQEMREELKRERDKRDRKEQMDQMMQLMMLNMFQKTAEAQTPTTLNGLAGQPANIQETLDPSGKVVQRTISQNNGMGAGGVNPMMEVMMKNMAEERNILLQAMLQKDNSKPFENLLVSLIGQWKTNNDPIDSFLKIRQALPEIFDKKKEENPTNLDALRLKFDTEMAMWHEKIELKKLEHEWSAEREEKLMADQNTTKWVEMLQSLGKDIIGPAATRLTEGFAQGLMQKQTGGMGGAGAAAQAAQIQAAQMAQMQAMAQQQQAQQQQQQMRMVQQGTAVPPELLAQQAELQRQQYMRQAAMQAHQQRGGVAPTGSAVAQANSEEEQAFFRMTDQDLDAVRQEFERRAMEMEVFGSKLQTEMARRKLVNGAPSQQQRQRSAQQEEESDQEYVVEGEEESEEEVPENYTPPIAQPRVREDENEQEQQQEASSETPSSLRIDNSKEKRQKREYGIASSKEDIIPSNSDETPETTLE